MSAALASAKKRRGAPQPPTNSGPIPSSTANSCKVNTTPGGNTKQMFQSQQPQQPMPTTGMSLSQVINIFDRRLMSLETSVRDIKNNVSCESARPMIFPENVPSNLTSVLDEMNERLDTLTDEFNSRFELLATELAKTNDELRLLKSDKGGDKMNVLNQDLSDLKNVVLKLQEYTMDVNRVLLRDQIKNQVTEHLAEKTTVDVSEDAPAYRFEADEESEHEEVENTV